MKQEKSENILLAEEIIKLEKKMTEHQRYLTAIYFINQISDKWRLSLIDYLNNVFKNEMKK